ncbi:UNVERIFIED_CONTAM: hypothetical protein Slati_0220200 [Sesamum latifolium]|uniref:RNase H type-1 domain-containing protein n=1 Tax=Sesamum latifolium TaxID=2727402 RepID=A0AAW2YCB1_9LAMI
MWIYLALSEEATSTVLTRKSKGTHLPVYYTSRLLQNAEYEAVEKEVWDLFVDGSVAEKWAGGGVVLKNSEKGDLKFAIRFEEPLSNNEAEYEALLCGLKIAQENGIRRIRVHCDSQLVVEQVTGGYEAKDDRMKKLMQKVRDQLSAFQN